VSARLGRLLSVTGYVYGWYILPAVLGLGGVLYYWGAGLDFDANVWRPAKAVLDGHSPYPPPDLTALFGHATFLYPPPLLWVDVPLSLLPHAVARGAFWALSAGAVYAGLRAAGIRDRRVQFCAAISFPVWFAEIFGNPTLLLMVPLALAWRHRDRPWAVGAAVGAAVALKLVLWPLGLWLLATRRVRGSAIAVATALASVFGTWALIGFQGLGDYPRLVRIFSETSGGPRGYTISTFAHHLGLSTWAGRGIQLACGLALLALIVRVAGSEQGDRRAFSLAVVAALVVSPMVEIHYLAVLLVPLAVACPDYGRPWQLVRAAWIFALMPHGSDQILHDHGRVLHSIGPVPTIPQLLVVLGFLAGVAVVTCRPPGGFRRVRAGLAVRAPVRPPRTARAQDAAA
jgi:Glycosyltransferase family 87